MQYLTRIARWYISIPFLGYTLDGLGMENISKVDGHFEYLMPFGIYLY
jgi:hypothetical protein